MTDSNHAKNQCLHQHSTTISATPTVSLSPGGHWEGGFMCADCGVKEPWRWVPGPDDSDPRPQHYEV